MSNEKGLKSCANQLSNTPAVKIPRCPPPSTTNAVPLIGAVAGQFGILSDVFSSTGFMIFPIRLRTIYSNFINRLNRFIFIN